MPTYSLTAINVGGFPLGESDKVVLLFSGEKGLTRAVAKGARKPGAKMAGKSEALCVNRLLLAKGRSLDIITQAESVTTYGRLRTDLTRLTYGLYYAELAAGFGEGLEDESDLFFELLLDSLSAQERAEEDPHLLCLEFELTLIRLLGFSPELSVCVSCRSALTERNLSGFVHGLGGIMCDRCAEERRAEARARRRRWSRAAGNSADGHSAEDSGSSSGYEISSTDIHAGVAEKGPQSGYTRESVDAGIDDSGYPEKGTYLTPLVWKMLVSAGNRVEQRLGGYDSANAMILNDAQSRAVEAARRLIQRYIEDRLGRKIKSLAFLDQISN